ncbi:hypothetical protein AN958_03962 [Leucoagaricus sp. SymC.cos]|nr:hypothetical protein AN958_03962 [Leucoagaricus sp. SymC.cos]
MPPPEYGHQPPSHLHKHPPPPPGASTPLFPTPVPVAGQTRIPMSHSPPIGGSSYTPGPPPSTPRRPQSQLATPQPPHAHSSPSTHPSPAMASLQNPALGNSPWGPGVSGPGIVDARESQLRDRNPPALTSERDRERAADRDREMSLSLRDRERELDYQRDRARGKPPPAGPGVPPPLAGPGTGAPPPVGPGVPPMLGPGIPEDPHKISSSSAPGSSGPSRAHSRSQLAKDELMDHSREMDRGLRMPERDMPPTGPARTHDYPPPREQLSYPRDADIHGTPSSRRDREEYIGPGGPSGSSRLPPPPGSYRTSGEFGREPPPPQDYRREHPDYRRPVDYPREPPHPQRDYRREPPPGDYRREPPLPAEYRRDGLPTDYRRDGPPAEYRDYRREPPPPVDYRREPPSADYRRDPPPPDYRGAPDYRDSRRDLPPPPGPGHSPEAYRREVPEYRRDRDPQDHPSSRRNSNEHRHLRRGDPGAGPGIPPGERQPRRSPHQTRDMDRDPYTRRHEDYRREPPPGPPPHDYRGGPPPPHPPEGYRSDYRGPPGDYRPPPPPPDYPPRRDHAPPPQDYRRDEYPRQPSHSHPSSAPPPPIHPGQDIRPPPGPPGDYRGPPGPDYRRDVPPGPPPPQDYRRDAPPPGDYRGPPGSLPPQNDYPRQGPPPPHSQDYRGREPGEIPPGPGGRDYPRRERDREHLRDSGDYSRGPPGAEYPPRRRDDSGEYLGRPPPPGSIPPGPGVPGRTVTPNSDPYAVKHPSERERERDKDRERWEREQRERVHYPPGSQPPSGPPPPGNAPPSHHSHSHSHPKSHSHPHHHHGHHHHVIHSHPHQGPSSSGPPPPGGGSGSQGGPPSGQGGAPPPPSQRQLQSQFPTRFVSHTTHPGSRMGSPVPGGPPGSGGVIGPGGSSSSRKDMSGNISTGKDKKIMSSRGGPSGGPVPGSGSGRRERDEREKDRDREREREMFPPQPPHQPVPHRGEQGRVLGHGYPPLPHGAHPHGPHGQPYDDYMVVDGMDPQQQQQQQQAQLEQQQMQMQGQHPHHPHPHAHGHPHGHPMQMLPQPPPVLPHHTHPLAPQVGYYPGSQEGAPGVEDLWPMQEQPDREVKARFKINLGTFVYPNTPFPYHFDVGEWIGVNGALAKDGEKKEDAAVKDKDEAKEKEKENGKEGEQTTSQKEEADDMLDVETQATIVIPNGYIPREKPRKPAIWGGGVIDSPARPKKRRIYTDDSDLFLCALHSGWLTWTASARARDRGQDLRIEVRIIRCAGAGAGSVYAVGAGAFAGKYAPAVNGVVSTNGAYRQNGNGKVPVVRKEEIIGRFIGGWGEKCFVHDTNADTGDEEENSEENDGRGLVSAGWGSGHDGSAIEVLNVEFVNVSLLDNLHCYC